MKEDRLIPVIPDELLAKIPEEKREGLFGILKGDPRPSYHHDPERIYGFHYAGLEIRFRVADSTLTVVDITEETP